MVYHSNVQFKKEKTNVLFRIKTEIVQNSIQNSLKTLECFRRCFLALGMIKKIVRDIYKDFRMVSSSLIIAFYSIKIGEISSNTLINVILYRIICFVIIFVFVIIPSRAIPEESHASVQEFFARHYTRLKFIKYILVLTIY